MTNPFLFGMVMMQPYAQLMLVQSFFWMPPTWVV